MKKSRIIVSLMLALAVVFLFTSGPEASLVWHLSLDEMTVKAEKIVLGSVSGKESFWDAEHGKIITRSTLKVEQVIKGESNEQVITVEQPGGEVGNIGMHVQGVARFQTGEDTLLFLEGKGAKYTVLGLSQGKISVKKQPETGQRIAIQEDTGLTVQKSSGVTGSMTTIGPMELSELVNRIKAVLNSQ